MPANVAVAIELADKERARLKAWTRRRTSAQALALRSRNVLLAAAGLRSTEIAERLGIPRNMAATWRSRFAASGASGRRAHRRTASGPAAHGHQRAGRRSDRQDARDDAQGRDALVDALDCARGRPRAVSGAADLARVRAATAPPGHAKAVRIRCSSRGPRRDRASPKPARARCRHVRRREITDPGGLRVCPMKCVGLSMRAAPRGRRGHPMTDFRARSRCGWSGCPSSGACAAGRQRSRRRARRPPGWVAAPRGARGRAGGA
jgi:hypothetical protein